MLDHIQENTEKFLQFPSPSGDYLINAGTLYWLKKKNVKVVSVPIRGLFNLTQTCVYDACIGSYEFPSPSGDYLI